MAPSTIKYLAFLPTKPPILYEAVADYRAERLGFTTVPDGDWNIGRLDLDTKIDRLYATKHGKGKPARGGRMAPSPITTEWYPDSIFAVIQETLVYSRIEGRGIGPRFLAHITENGERVCGYMLESPQPSFTVSRLFMGALSSRSFLIRNGDGQALLHNFGGTFSTEDENVFKEEMASVEEVLQRGLPPSTQHLSNELLTEMSAIYQRDDAEDGKITITEEEHKGMLRILREGLNKARSRSKPIIPPSN
ncbi:hypothetical protein N431DRAFT_499398 [Stipitochalara longipes BDJ]|nr:hypothetical protein N431DRAFT_499398 [Stipitochalara longipes BDJ]